MRNKISIQALVSLLVYPSLVGSLVNYLTFCQVIHLNTPQQKCTQEPNQIWSTAAESSLTSAAGPGENIPNKTHSQGRFVLFYLLTFLKECWERCTPSSLLFVRWLDGRQKALRGSPGSWIWHTAPSGCCWCTGRKGLISCVSVTFPVITSRLPQLSPANLWINPGLNRKWENEGAEAGKRMDITVEAGRHTDC